MASDRMRGDPHSTPSIQVDAVVYKVQTLVDNGIRVTLDLPESAIMQAAQLMECQRAGAVLDIKCIVKQLENNSNAIQKGDVRKSQRQTA